MAQSKFAKRLATMQKKYEAAQAPAGFGECPLEVGRYRAKISAELKDIAGKMAIEWSFTVVEGDFEGETATQLDGLENENSFGYLKKRLKQFGYDPDDVQLAESLESILDQINESELVGVIQVKQNGDYTNVYLNKVELEESDDAEEDGAEESEEESEEEAEEEASDEDENDSEDEEEAEEEEAEEEATIEKGSTVLYQKPKSKKAEEFEVLSVDEKKGTAKLKGIPTSVPLAELTLVEAEEEAEEEEVEEVEEEADAEEEDDDTVELEVGSKVACDIKGRPVKGTVVSIDADSETAKVKTADGKTLKVSFEQISAL